MISQQTINQLHDMHLSFLAGDIKERQADASFCELSFDEQITVIVDREWHRRRSKRITDLIREGQFCCNSASVLEIDYAQERGLVKKQINELAACSYIENGHNIMIMGATGVGKSYLACALGTAACRNRYSCRYTRTPELLDQLAMARTDGSVRQIIQQYRKPRLLILDEWLITRISHGGLEDIFEIMECRNTEQRSTIFCSQIETSEWLAALGNSLMAESLMDRIIHSSYKIVLHGDSMRKKKGLKSIQASTAEMK